jgi:hypothetical protein
MPAAASASTTSSSAAMSCHQRRHGDDVLGFQALDVAPAKVPANPQILQD